MACISEKVKIFFKSQTHGLGRFIVLLLVFITFLYKPFKIPTSSMVPTLQVGDFLIVDKFRYGYSRYSLPFRIPVIDGRIGFSPLERGEVVVFNHPKDPEDDWSGLILEKLGIMKKTGKDYIKRLIGLPGDTIQMIEGHLYINGKPLPLRQIEDFMYTDYRSGKVLAVHQFIETLPNGVEHHILKILPFGSGEKDNFGPVIVPPEHYFFMGDNRDASKDSRYLEDVGFIHKDFIVGQAKFIFFSTTSSLFEPWDWPFGIQGRLGRIFQNID
jgi:signal peptidase I